MFSLNQDKSKHPLFFSPPTSPHVPPFQRTPPPRCDASALPILAAQTFDCSRLHLPHHSRRTTEQTCAPKTPQRLSHSLSHKHTQRRDRNKHQRRTKPMEKTPSMPVYYKHKALTQSARARAQSSSSPSQSPHLSARALPLGGGGGLREEVLLRRLDVKVLVVQELAVVEVERRL